MKCDNKKIFNATFNNEFPSGHQAAEISVTGTEFFFRARHCLSV